MLPAMAKRSALFWAAVTVGTLCGACTLGTAALMALGVVASDDEQPASPSATSSAIPTGDTPGLFPGMPGWKPSGRGTAIPEAAFDGAPRGLWWAPRMDGAQTSCRVILFLADGTYADGPRPGGPRLIDLEGQRAENGTTGVGTFDVSGGSITMRHDGFSSTEPLTSGDDDDGTWFAIRSLKYRPVAEVPRDTLVGTWKTAGSRYVFHDDGTFEMGQVSLEAWAGASRKGRWTLDGYLLMLEPFDNAGWITTVGSTVGGRFLIVGDTLHSRE
ncbi:MAG: hypothetical protein AMXMBFR34_19910 [Myxococcaceae bacterium]